MVDCFHGPSWTGAWIPRRAFGLPDVMYIVNVSVDDCLLVHDAERRFVDAVGGSLSGRTRPEFRDHGN